GQAAPLAGEAKRKVHRWPSRYEVEERANIFKAFRADESAKDDIVLTQDEIMLLHRKPEINQLRVVKPASHRPKVKAASRRTKGKSASHSKKGKSAKGKTTKKGHKKE
ncbi:hypothetical protein DFQ26_001476, partial [Actinomortierella ambigua]